MTPQPRKQGDRSKPKALDVDSLEPRILMSATWVDPETGDTIDDPTVGNDRFEGSSGDDTADALAGDDLLLGRAGDDILTGGAGDDILRGGADNDTLDGGADTDRADYSTATSSVTVDITDVGTPQDTGGAGIDTLYGIEGVIGSDHDDSFGFSNPIPGQTYTVDGGAGFNTVDLGSYERADLTIAADGSSVVVDIGGGQSFTVEMTNVSRILTSDVTASDPPEIIQPPTIQVTEGETPQFGLLVVGGDPGTMSWTWTQTGGTSLSLDNANAARPIATIPEGLVDSSATFDVALTIGAETTVTSVEIAISADNDAANITASDLTAPENSVVNISASVDEPEGQPYLYTWTQVSGPAVTLNDAFTLNPSFTAPELTGDADIVFELSVTDGTTTATEQITVTVQASNDGPTANAGSDVTVAEDVRSTDNTGADTFAAQTYTLNGSGSDPEGESLTYSWRQTGGPAVTLDDSNLSNPTFTIPQGVSQYDLQFELTVSDGTNITTDTVTVTVAADQDAAVVDSLTGGIAGVGDESTTVAIAISAWDPEGTALTYSWRQVGGDPVVIADSSAASTTFTATNQLVDTYVSFEVDVTDEDGTTTTKNLTVLVTAANNLPTTDLGPDRTVGGNTLVTIPTTASDPEGQPLAHQWTQTSGPSVSFTGQGTETFSFVTPTVATTTLFTFEVQTMDGTHTVTDTITITVDPTEPVGDGGAGGGGGGGGGGGENIDVDIDTFSTTNEGDSTDLSIDVTAFGGPGPLTYSWTQTAGEPVTIVDANTADASFVAPELTGNQILKFEVEVSDGAETRTELVFVTVIADNDAPIVDAGPNQSVAEDGTINLAATQSDIEGKNLAGRWEQVSGPVVEIGDIYDPNTTLTAPNITANADVVMRWVSDDGENTVSDTVTITILADNDPPVVDAGSNTNIPEASSHRLSPSVSDPENQPLTYTWTQVSGPTVTLSDPNVAGPTFATPDVTSDTPIEFQLSVSDGVHTVTDNVTLTIVANDDPPSVDAGNFQSVSEGAIVSLNGTANDPEGQPMTVNWTQIGGPTVSLNDANTLNPTFTAPNELVNTYVTFRIDASDGPNSVSDTVTILINADNDAPTNDAGANLSVSEGATVNLGGTASDPEGQPLTHNWTQISGPPVTLTGGNGLTPTFEAPNVLNNETIVFQFESTDGTHTVVDTVSVTVTGSNDAPEATDGTSSGSEDATSITIKPTGTDPDFSDAIESIRIESLPSNGTLLFQGNPVTIGDVLAIADVDGNDLTFVPTADWGGTTSFEFRVSDGDLWSVDAGTQTINVAAVADEANIVTTNGTGDEDTAISVPASVATTDADGSETIRSITVRNAPEGSVFSDGSNTATFTSGSINITGWDLSNLTVTPPQDRDTDMSFDLRAQTEDSNGNRRNTTESVSVSINPINDAPYVSNLSTSTTEDTDVTITLTASEVDTGDAAESYRIDTLPDAADGTLKLNGAAITAGTTVTQAQINAGQLVFEPAPDHHGSTTFDFSAYDGELWSATSAEFTVTIDAEADAPDITAPTAITGNEDQPINLPISVATADTDSSESITNVTIASIPAGATVSDGVNTFTATSGTTSIDVTSWTTGDITITAPSNSDVDFTVQVTATSTEASNSDTASSTQFVLVNVDAVVDDVVLPSGSVTTTEDTAVNLGLGVVFTDTDGSESHVLVLGGVPDGATVTDGVNTFVAGGGSNSVDIGSWDLGSVTLTPPDDSDVDFQVTVTATTTEANGGASDTDSGTIDVSINAAADAPTLTVSPASGNEDTPINLAITTGLTDTDGSETLTTSVSSIPVGATITDGVNSFTATVGTTVVDISSWNNASLTITAPEDSDANFTLVVTATATESDGGATSATVANLPVTVNAAADAADITVTAAIGDEDTAISLDVSSQLTDTDGSESLTIELRDLPVGATISDGVNTFTASGAATTQDITGWDLNSLQITPPANSGDDFVLTVAATSTETNGGDTTTTTSGLPVTVRATADAPTVTSTDGSGNEDTAISFTITPGLTDTDGSENLTVAIEGIPVGATVGDGVNSFTASGAATTADVTGWNFGSLTVTPPQHGDTDFTLTIAATANEAEGDTTTTRTTSAFSVQAVADAPTITAGPATGNEDSRIPLAIDATLTDTDGSENLTLAIQGVPVGAIVSDGINTFTATVGTTNVDITSWTISDLTIQPPPDSGDDFSLTVVATATETNGGDTAVTTQSLPVDVVAVADAPNLTTTGGQGDEDTAIAFDITSSLTDTDGSEALSIAVGDVPVGATITDGTNTFVATNGTTTVSLDGWNLSTLTVTPPPDSDADFRMTATAISTEPNGSTTATSSDIPIVVDAIADAPTLATSPASGNEDAPIDLDIRVSQPDADGSEDLRLQVRGAPPQSVFTDGVNEAVASGNGFVDLTGWDLGSLTVSPPANLAEDFELLVVATSTEGDGGSSAASTSRIAVNVIPIADAPDATAPNDLQVLPNQPQPFPIDISTVDLDGSEDLQVRVSGLWSGVTFSAGTDNGDGSWTFRKSDLEGLTINAPPNGNAELVLEFTVNDGGSIARTETTTTIKTLDLVPVQPGIEMPAYGALPERDFDITAQPATSATPSPTDIKVEAQPFALPPVTFSTSETYSVDAETYEDVSTSNGPAFEEQTAPVEEAEAEPEPEQQTVEPQPAAEAEPAPDPEQPTSERDSSNVTNPSSNLLQRLLRMVWPSAR